MEHFKIEQWADLAREVASPEAAKEMQRHLDAGCKKCIEAFASMKTMTAIAGREAQYEPPAEVVRQARALMAQAGVRSRARDLMPLVFDSLLKPAMAGIRGAQATARQLLYQKGSCCIDIRLEQDAGKKRLNLIGQVLDSGEEGRGVGSILVEALQEEKPVATATTNSYGEFDLSVADSPQNLELCFGVSSRNCFWIKIPPLEEIPAPGIVVRK